MDTTRLSSKGQVILPKSIRAIHGWEPGAEFAVEDTPDGILLRPLSPFAATRLDEVAGSLEPLYAGPALSVEDMDRGVARAFARKRARG